MLSIKKNLWKPSPVRTTSAPLTTLLYAFSLCFAFLLISPTSVRAAAKMQISGQVVQAAETQTETPKPIGFATVVLMDSSGRAFGGAAADGNGRFTLEGNWKGKLTLVSTCIGYDRHELPIQLNAKQPKLNVGQIVLKPQVNAMKEVVVSARSITREADRFVIKLEGSDKVVGRSALEVVSESPGVWVGNDQLSINGKSGTVVIVNNRTLNMSFDELKLYLSNLKAEEIQRIEVIPNGGAEYDANARGGIIKITLRRQRLDGIEGSIGSDFSFSKHNEWLARPNFSLNAKKSNLQMYGSGTLTGGYDKFQTWQNTEYKYETPPTASYRPLGSESRSRLVRKYNLGNIKVGLIYDLGKSQSVGVEYAEFSRYRDREDNANFSTLLTPGTTTENNSLYVGKGSFHRRSLTTNYILQLDTVGSQIKLVGDFLLHQNPSSDVFENSSAKYLTADPLQRVESDSTYRTNTDPEYKVLTLSADVNYNFKGGRKLVGGAKFYNNTMLSGQLFEEWKTTSSEWQKNDILSFDNKYVERITAAYLKYSAKWKFISYSAGLRAEHTYAHPKTTQLIGQVEEISESTQRYVNWFPNFNISSPLDSKGLNMLILNYDRKISRPSFWQINPFRTQLSEYSYVTGNPDLNPNISDDLSLTYVFKYKYTFTVGATFEKDEIQQSGSVDSLSPDVFLIRFENTKRSNAYYFSVNAPMNPTKWWSLNLNLTGVFQEVTMKDETRTNPLVMGNFSNTFTLPQGFILDFGGFGCSRALSGNMDVKPMYGLNLGIKRLFFEKKLSVSLRLDNPILGSNDIRIKMLDKLDPAAALANPNAAYETLNFTHARGMFPTVRMSIRYNFSGGKTFKTKRVEAANTDMEKRINRDD